MTNRLTASASPYLLQHQDNPVDWYEWGEEALADADRLDRPILLSVGYATCHWCHVMAHESFEDEATAAYMNDHFVNIKVDREERPDIDRIYMDAVQAMTGRGGWPMTVFLTPAGEPFFAGTYYPKEARGHHPSFRQIMESIVAAWESQRDELGEQAARLTDAVRAGIPPAATTPSVSLVDGAVAGLAGRFDWEHGGFGGAPKFPQAPNLELLLRVLALDLTPDRRDQVRAMLTTTLDRMAAGGIYDHLGGGFSRYSVDRHWLVPHFEKMLYDNALLARIYLRAWQVTGFQRYRRTAEETLDYMLRDLGDPRGGFYSGEDADSEGEEGKFYVWSWDELAHLLGPELPLFAATYGASPEGNFEGSNVLHRPASFDEVAGRFALDADQVRRRTAAATQLLLEARSDRVRPGTDDKIVTAWNGLALRALAEAAAVLASPRYLDAARRLADFAVAELRNPEGRLVRTWRHGVQGPAAFCDDYGALAVGLFTLYQVTAEEEWYTEALRLVDEATVLFGDGDGDGFFATGTDAERLIARPKNLFDNPTPSDNALMAEALQIATAYTGDAGRAGRMEGIVNAAGTLIERHPGAVGHLLAVVAAGLHGPREVAVVGDPQFRTAMSDVIWERFRPDCVLAAAFDDRSSIPLLHGRTAPDDSARAYVCRGFVCEMPVDEPEALRQLLA